MIDLRIVREQPDLVRDSQRARGEDPAAVDRLVSADTRRRTAVAAFDRLRAEQKAAGKTISAAKGDERAALLDRAKALAAEVRAADDERAGADADLREAWLAVSNLVDERAPVGGEDDFVVLETVGEPAEYGFEVRDHADLGEILGAIDIARGAKVSGARFYFLTGVGARLELALVDLAMARAVEAGLTPMVAPALVRPSAMEGTGFLGAHASEVYRLAEDDLYLVGTSEVPMAAYHSDETLDPAELPRRYAGFSPCFRREAGSYGKDTKGVFRVHWFDKVEMFSFCEESEAAEEHRRLLGWEKEFLADLELPYRVIDVATGDLGASAVRKFDCEAWFPSQGRYRELTSASNCTTFQARRLGVRTRDSAGRTTPVATLNGTLCAVTRTIAALLENHQRADGSVRVPEALRRYLGGMSELSPVHKPVSA